jgi:hypothetical protein
MTNETVVAGSSPADADPFEGRNIGVDEYIRSRAPQPADSADSATVDKPEETADDSAPDSDPDAQAVVPPKGKVKSQTAEQRIAQLDGAIEKEWNEAEPNLVRIAQFTTTIEKIRQGAGLARKTEPAPVASQPQQASQPQPQHTRPKPTPEGHGPNGKPYETYEEYIEDAARWAAEQERAKWESDLAQREAIKQVNATRSKAQEIYEDFEEVASPAADVVMRLVRDPNVSDILKRTVFDPDGFHILYALGSDPEISAKFEKMALTDPAEAIYIWKQLKAEAQKHLTSDADEPKGGETPEPKRTQAPKPPSPVSGASSRAFDVSDDSLSADEWMRKRNAQIEKRQKH